MTFILMSWVEYSHYCRKKIFTFVVPGAQLRARASILGWMRWSLSPHILEWDGRGVVAKYYCILIVSYNVQEYEMKTCSKVVTFQI